MSIYVRSFIYICFKYVYISDEKTYKEYTLKLEPDVYLQQISENDYQATVDYDVIMIEIFATAKHCSCAISFGDLFKSQRYFFLRVIIQN